MNNYIAFLGLIAAVQVAAYPNKWNEKGICTIPGPQIGYHEHKDPIQDAALAFTLADAAGAVTAWNPQQTYTLTVSYPKPARMWVITSDGSFDFEAIGCDGRSAFNLDVGTSAAITWTAPNCCDGPITVGVTAAMSETDTYRQSTVMLDCDPAAPKCTVPKPPPPPPAPIPEEGEGSATNSTSPPTEEGSLAPPEEGSGDDEAGEEPVVEGAEGASPAVEGGVGMDEEDQEGAALPSPGVSPSPGASPSPSANTTSTGSPSVANNTETAASGAFDSFSTASVVFALGFALLALLF